jgi:hypothetical protein
MAPTPALGRQRQDGTRHHNQAPASMALRADWRTIVVWRWQRVLAVFKRYLPGTLADDRSLERRLTAMTGRPSPSATTDAVRRFLTELHDQIGDDKALIVAVRGNKIRGNNNGGDQTR